MTKFLLPQKLLHGQQSDQSLSRSDLRSRIDGIREWCERLSDSCDHELGYDGFARAGSLRKSGRPDLPERVDVALNGLPWDEFVKNL